MHLILINSNLQLILLHKAPEAVTGLQYKQSYLGNLLVNISVQWMVSLQQIYKVSCVLQALATLLQPPPSSSRPPVIGYIVSHNASGTIEMNVTNNTNFVIRIIRPKIILFSVSTLNILGNGRGNSIISKLIFIST